MNEIADSGASETIELLVAPIPPDTVATVKAEVASTIRDILEESDHANLWEDGEIKVEVEKALSLEEQLVVVGVQLLSALAAKTFETIVLPKLQKRFEVKKRKRKKKRAKKSSKKK